MHYNNCAGIVAACTSAIKNRLYTQWKSALEFKCWNGQTVWKFKESTVKAIRIKIKTVRESVNPCDIKKIGESHDTASCATIVR